MVYTIDSITWIREESKNLKETASNKLKIWGLAVIREFPEKQRFNMDFPKNKEKQQFC